MNIWIGIYYWFRCKIHGIYHPTLNLGRIVWLEWGSGAYRRKVKIKAYKSTLDSIEIICERQEEK